MLVSKLSIAILDATLDFVRNFIRLLLVLATNESLQAGVAYFLRIEYSETNKEQSPSVSPGRRSSNDRTALKRVLQNFPPMNIETYNYRKMGEGRFREREYTQHRVV